MSTEPRPSSTSSSVLCSFYFKLGDIKDKVRELVAVRLTKPGSNDEQRVWDELMELVNDG